MLAKIVDQYNCTELNWTIRHFFCNIRLFLNNHTLKLPEITCTVPVIDKQMTEAWLSADGFYEIINDIQFQLYGYNFDQWTFAILFHNGQRGPGQVKALVLDGK